MTDLGAPAATGNGHTEPPRAQRCETCMWFFVEKRDAKGKPEIAACRRYPPQIIMVPKETVNFDAKGNAHRGMQLQPMAPFVPMDPNSWCGEWASEPKVFPGRVVETPLGLKVVGE